MIGFEECLQVHVLGTMVQTEHVTKPSVWNKFFSSVAFKRSDWIEILIYSYGLMGATHQKFWIWTEKFRSFFSQKCKFLTQKGNIVVTLEMETMVHFKMHLMLNCCLWIMWICGFRSKGFIDM